MIEKKIVIPSKNAEKPFEHIQYKFIKNCVY